MNQELNVMHGLMSGQQSSKELHMWAVDVKKMALYKFSDTLLYRAGLSYQMNNQRVK